MKNRLLIAFAVILGLCVFAYPYARDALMQFDRATQRAFDALPMGITLDDASTLLESDPIRFATQRSAACPKDKRLNRNLKAPKIRTRFTSTYIETARTGITAWALTLTGGLSLQDRVAHSIFAGHRDTQHGSYAWGALCWRICGT